MTNAALLRLIKRTKIIYGAVAFCLLMPTTFIYAWDSVGHRLIAEIAYRNLAPTTRQQVDSLTQLIDPGYSPQSRFLFAATIPDRLRSMGNLSSDNNPMHYINYPFSDDGTPIPNTPLQSNNVIAAIQQNINILKDTNSQPAQKATALLFVEHFVGDAHQPLHASNRFSKEFPRGDRGGNLYRINDRVADNLHKFWDRGAGSFRDFGHPLTNRKIKQFADKIIIDFPQSYFKDQAKDLNPQHWTLESLLIARTFVYHVPENTSPSHPYRTQAKQIVEQRIALAGYRLANVLNSIFK